MDICRYCGKRLDDCECTWEDDWTDEAPWEDDEPEEEE